MHEPTRCAWAMGANDAMRDYHDREWGVPLHDDRALFEFLCLEGAQAGLSWRTVLDKRENYRRAFHDFDIARCAKLTDGRIKTLLGDAGLIRNRLKITSVRDNARAALAAIDEFGSLDAYLWSFVGGEIPAAGRGVLFNFGVDVVGPAGERYQSFLHYEGVDGGTIWCTDDGVPKPSVDDRSWCRAELAP